MWLILFWLICSIAVIAERSVYLFGASINKDVFLATMQKCILAGDIAKAVKMCSAANAPLARIVQAGLVKVNRPDEEVQAAMDEAALREMPKITKRTGFLALFANLAMLCGLVRNHRRPDQGVRRGRRRVGRSEPEGAHPGGRYLRSHELHGVRSARGHHGARSASPFLNGKTQGMEDDINEASVQVLNLVVANRQKVNLQGLEG